MNSTKPKIISTNLVSNVVVLSYPNPLGLSEEELALIESEKEEFIDLEEYRSKFVSVIFEVPIYRGSQGELLRAMMMSEIQRKTEEFKLQATSAYEKYIEQTSQWRELKILIEVNNELTSEPVMEN